MIKYKKGLKFQTWRKSVFERDKYTCQHCGRNDKLEAHHIIPWNDSFELRIEISNGLTLCISCHARHHILQPESKMAHKKGKPAWNKGLKVGIGGPKGRPCSEEHKRKIGEKNSKWVRTEEYKQKLKDAKTPENKEANRLRFKGRSWKLDSETGKRVWI